ncbi:MFS general substrate transporter [Punctularia strigosozonata HHB-11173 SS5]|uniref:MFS general substrate transporter n=1 Tax=Punctularia strigosozonata (strain HHB-11173) TaxID=741275 RepID=UPI00044166E8|nr:MFS general substrate transporter [Punctularia strigosozonata HHB-11173 SS5]EIN10930.1 MFS general substrate transporter [Punctularia strigosozonata HHB-11173 SS5]
MPADKEKYGRNDAQVEYAATADAQSPTDQVVYFVNGERRIYVPGSDLEKRMVRKIDLHMFTCVCILYLLNYLDRQNIGNAKVAGMQDDLKLSSSDYSVALLVFFPAYLLGEIPSNLILTRVKPSIYLPGITMVWGVIATLMSQVQTKESLIGVRFVLGFVESGFFCGVLFLLSSWYRKNEMSRRMAYLYAAAILSGAFGGLLAGGVIDGLEGARGIRGWRWLFIIEGALTVFFSIIFVFVLPNWPANTSWLTEEEKALADARIRADRVGTMGASARMSSWNGVLSALSDWRMYLLTLMYMYVSFILVYFIPTLTTNLGFTGRAAQWMTVPVYIVTLVVEMILAYSSDYFNERAFHIAIPLCISGIMYALSIGIANHHAQYVFLCFGFGGIWGALPIILAWTPNVINYPNEKRAVVQAFVNMVGNLASVYGAYLWPASDAPRYKMGLGVTSAMCFISSICKFNRIALCVAPE